MHKPLVVQKLNSKTLQEYVTWKATGESHTRVTTPP
jgi:hypothetical protein